MVSLSNPEISTAYLKALNADYEILAKEIEIMKYFMTSFEIVKDDIVTVSVMNKLDFHFKIRLQTMRQEINNFIDILEEIGKEIKVLEKTLNDKESV